MPALGEPASGARDLKAAIACLPRRPLKATADDVHEFHHDIPVDLSNNGLVNPESRDHASELEPRGLGERVIQENVTPEK